MNDTLTITDLSLWTRIGVPDAERETEQRLHLTITMSTDAAVVAKDDDIQKGIDYDAVCKAVRELGNQERKTIEKLAEDIADLILRDFSVEKVDVTVKKYVIPGTENVSVSIERERN